MVGQMQTNAECLRMIEKHEERHGICFGWISRSRPDLVHLGSGNARGAGAGGTVPRYDDTELFAPDRTRDVFMDTRDWFLLTRRRNARGALDVLDMYSRCNRSRTDLKTHESWLRASIGSEGGHDRTLNLPVALAHPESCAVVCPQAATSLARITSTAFLVRKGGCTVATPEACVDDVPVTCGRNPAKAGRNPGCSQALVRLVGERRAEESARQTFRASI